MQTLIGLTIEELSKVAESFGEPAFRGKQVARWIYRGGASEIDLMTDLPNAFRSRLQEEYCVGLPAVSHRDGAPDGTCKYLLKLADGEQIESVYLPYPDRVSVCLSSQAGCPAGCAFCATAQGGLARNLSAGEIVAQILALRLQHTERRISHAVYMGMGEPLLNYGAVVKCARMLTEEVGMSGRNLTISTVGVVPGILRLAKEKLPVTLALSLHAPNDKLREELIPTARKWSIAEILEACRTYWETTRRNLTFEYLLLGGINDDPRQAQEMARLLQGLPGNVNLIPFNYVETPEGFRRPTAGNIAAFRTALEAEGRVTTQRMERGHSIGAACGQLRRSAGLPSAPAIDRSRQLAVIG